MQGTTATVQATDRGTINPWTLIYWFQDNAFIMVLSTLLGLTVALGIFGWMPPVYAAKAMLEIANDDEVLPGIQRQAAPEDVSSAVLLKTIEQTIAGNSVLERVAVTTHLADDPEFAAVARDHPGTSVSDFLRQRISVNLVRGTRLILVTVEASSPHKARQLAQALVDTFFSQTLANRRDESGSARDFLVAEAERLKVKLNAAELRLQQYREKYDAMAIADRQNLVIDRLRHLHEQLGDARNTRLTLESEQAQLVAALASHQPGELLKMRSIAARPEVIELRRQLDVQNAQVAADAVPYGENHPVLKQARRQRDETEAQLNSALRSAAESMVHYYEAAKSTEELLQGELARQEKAAVELDRVAIPYHALERDLQSDGTLYSQILTRLKETDVTQNLITEHKFSGGYVHLIEKPYAEMDPVRPRWQWLLAGGVLGGGLFGCALALLRLALDDSVPSVDAAEACVGAATLAVVPSSKRLGFRRGRITLPAPGSPDAEAFRLLRTSLALRQPPDSHRTIMFTSAVPGEGKSCCAINYAAIEAQGGRRTLIIDGDLRRPRLLHAFERYVEKPGVADCLVDPTRLAAAIDYTGLPNLALLGSRHGTSRAADLLAGDNLRLILEQCQEWFDCVVVDTAPVAVVSDALCFVRHIPTICLVVHAGRTPRRFVRRARTLINEVAGRPLAGVVLNQIQRHRASSYYYFFYGNERYGGRLPAATAAG